MTDYEKYIQPFVDFFQNDPKYISNNQIASYFNSNNLTANAEAVRVFSGFYRSIGAKRYSLKTVKSYISALRRVNAFVFQNYGIPVDKLTSDIALRYFLHLQEDKKVSYSTVRAHRFAVKYYFYHVLKKHIDLSFINGMRRDHHLPSVLTRHEILWIIKKINNGKHRKMISLLYSSGVRVSKVGKDGTDIRSIQRLLGH